MRKIIAVIILILISLIGFSQSKELVIKDKIWVSIPFNKGSFQSDILVNKDGVVKLILTVDNIGSSVDSLELYIRTEMGDVPGIRMIASNQNGKFHFNVSTEQNEYLKQYPVECIGVTNLKNNKSIYGSLFNKWIFTDLIPYQIKTKLNG